MYGIHGIPLEAQYLYRKGMELSAQERHEAAARCLRQAVTIAPRFTGAYRELGNCLIRLGRDEAAQDCFQRIGQTAYKRDRT